LKSGDIAYIPLPTLGLARIVTELVSQFFQSEFYVVFVGPIREFEAFPCLKPQFRRCSHSSASGWRFTGIQ
jgi:hypothetical protein